MNIDNAKKVIKKEITKLTKNKKKINDQTKLIGSSSLIDSMKLVQLCLQLEDIAEKNQFTFDWTSEKAMSKSMSIFRTVSSLAKEFSAQSVK